MADGTGEGEGRKVVGMKNDVIAGDRRLAIERAGLGRRGFGVLGVPVVNGNGARKFLAVAH